MSEIVHEEFEEPWEEWDPSKESFALHLISGSFAGMSEHLIVYPLDTVKTFIQTEGSSFAKLQELVSKEGFIRLWRGVPTTLMGCIPAHAAYFSIYEWGKIKFGADGPSHAPVAAAASGAFAVVAHDAIMTPLDVVKQRLQLGFHNGVFDCFKSIVRTEGASALFLSLPTTLMMNFPFAAVSVSANETLKKILNPTGAYHLPTFLLCGGLAGGIAAVITTPLDVIKTRLQTQHILSSIRVMNQDVLPHSVNIASGNSLPIHSPHTHSTTTATIANSNNGLSTRSLTAQFRRHFLPSSFGSGMFPFKRPIAHANMPSLVAGIGASRFKYKLAATRCHGPMISPDGMLTGTTTWCGRQGTLCNREACVAASSSQAGARGISNNNHHKTRASPFIEKSLPRYSGMLDVATRIYKEEGWAAFWRGARPRMLVQAPSVAISWSSYESAKLMFGSLGV